MARSLLAIGVSVRGERVPDFDRLGPVILAPNHVSFLDPVVLQLVCRQHLRFLMTETIYRAPLLRWLFRLWGAIPVPQQGSSAGALKQALRFVRSGEPVVIFPEGRISLDGRLQYGRGGVVVLIARARVPVIPVAILGTFEVLPRWARFLRPGRVTIRFGDPLPPPELDDREAGRRFLDRIMDEIHRLGAPRRG